MAADWMGEASSNPILSIAFNSSGERPSSVKSFFCTEGMYVRKANGANGIGGGKRNRPYRSYGTYMAYALGAGRSQNSSA